MNGLETQYKSAVNFYRFDANDPENQQLQNALQLRGHPSVAIINQNDEVVQRLFGVQQEDALTPILDMLAESG
ncbi:MAG: hypothetical protein ACI9EW_002301 [Cellvibrionaceae bacterium]